MNLYGGAITAFGPGRWNFNIVAIVLTAPTDEEAREAALHYARGKWGVNYHHHAAYLAPATQEQIDQTFIGARACK